MKQRIVALLLIISLNYVSLYSQETTVPAPYKPDEFPPWTMDLRRAEIVTIGSFPLSFIFTAIIYDVSIYAVDYSNYDGTVNANKPEFGSHREQSDIVNLILISAGVSVAIGLADFIVQRVKKNRLEKEKQELNEQRKNNSQSTGLSENES